MQRALAPLHDAEPNPEPNSPAQWKGSLLPGPDLQIGCWDPTFKVGNLGTELVTGYTPESTNSSTLTVWPPGSECFFVFLYQPVVSRVHGIVFQGVVN